MDSCSKETTISRKQESDEETLDSGSEITNSDLISKILEAGNSSIKEEIDNIAKEVNLVQLHWLVSQHREMTKYKEYFRSQI